MSEFLALLRSFIHDTPPEGAQTWDIAALSQTALRQNLLPVLAYENKRWQLFAADDVKKQLDAILYGAVTGNLNRCASFEQLSQQLTAHGIAHMPVKGYYLRQLYPVPELRTFGDIDILIHPEDRRKAHQLMMALGYTAGQDWEPTCLPTSKTHGNTQSRTRGCVSAQRWISTSSIPCAIWPSTSTAAARASGCIWTWRCMSGTMTVK